MQTKQKSLLSRYVVHPWTTETLQNQQVCFVVNGTQQWQMNRPQPMIPDLSEFEYLGDGGYKGLTVHVYQLKQSAEGKVNTYTMFVDAATKHPVW